jgi:hypothetical protein
VIPSLGERNRLGEVHPRQHVAIARRIANGDPTLEVLDTPYASISPIWNAG